MIWGYIPLNSRTNRHVKFYTAHDIPYLVKNERVYVRCSSFLEELKISSRPTGKNLRAERLIRNGTFLTYSTKVSFDGKEPVYGIVAAQKLGVVSALMMNPLHDLSEVVPRGLIGM